MGFLRDQGKRVSQLQFYLTWLKNIVLVLAALIGLGLAILGYKVGQHLMQIPDLSFLENYNPVQTVQIFDRNDKLIVTVDGAEKRIIVPLAAVSKNMQKALLAAEDHHFYEHKGVSPVGILRALLSNLTHGHVVEGGSTITQQLAKNLFFEGEKRSIDLKLAELFIAMAIENKFSKDKILELYLNEIYFGNSAYGIEQASRNYFGKKASQLSLAESAYLAGIIRAPSRGAEAQNRMSSINRQHEVLQKMAAYGFISEMQKQEAMQQWLQFKAVAETSDRDDKIKIPKYPYYVSAVLDMLHGRFNAAAIERQGMKIYTNLDVPAQETAERALAQGLARAPYGVNQGALVSIRVSDGAVMALVGGVGSYEDNQWNCATNPHTIGSAFKPFVYLAAFEKGVVNEYSEVEDTPFSIVMDTNGKEYKPKNFDNKFLGTISIAKAFAYSRNIPALRIGQAAGIDSVINAAQRAGITENMAPELSVSLGCSASSPLHVANAYATLARGGVFIAPRMVRRVETRAGRVLQSFNQETNTVFDRASVAQIVDLMQDCVAEGTGQLAKLADRPVAGKTGTADQGKDLWFVGFTPDMVTAVWGGNKDNKPVGGSVTGGTVMARIWHDYEAAYYKKVPTPGGFFLACNRAPASLGVDKPYEPPRTQPVGVATSSGYVSLARQLQQKKRRPAYTGYKAAPSGAAVVRADRGVTEYSWSRK